MPNKTLISLAVASSIALTGCFDDGSSSKNADPDYKISSERYSGKTWPLFNPLTGEIPIPNDLIFDSVAGDGTFAVNDSQPPVTTALNNLSGASTVAPAVIQFNGQIDPASVNGNPYISDPADPNFGKPNPDQNVFLLELDYASGDPVRALSLNEPPTLSQSPLFYEAQVVSLDGESAIRVTPLKPLSPGKRYIVAVTDSVKDVNGDPIVASPTYDNLTLPADAPIINKALGTVRSLINNLWEGVAQKYFAATQNPGNIVFSYSFTTSNDEKVLPYIAEPAAWFKDQLTSYIRVNAATRLTGAARFANGETLPVARYDINGDDSVTAADFDNNGDGSLSAADFDLDGNGKFEHADVALAANNAVSTFPSASIAAAIPAFGAAPPTGCAGLQGETAIECVAYGSAAQFSGLPTPGGRTVNASTANATDAVALSVILSSIVDPGQISVVQGDISLPYYLGTEGADLVTDSWTADNQLATQINTAFADLGLKIPQADPAVSDVVNYVFPFPEKTADVTAPMLVMYPSGAPLTGGMPVVIFQHGITTDRSAALAFGSALIQGIKSATTANVAVVAIDLPLHGVSAFSEEDQLALAGQLLGAQSESLNTETNRAAVVAGQFSTGVLQTLAGTGCVSVDFADPADVQLKKSQVAGGLCDAEAAQSMLSALGLEQTVSRAGSTIAGLERTENERHFGFTANAQRQPTPMVFDTDAPVGESGSLFINLNNFMATRDNLRQGTVDMMNLRKSLGSVDMNADGNADFDAQKVFFIGHSLGTINGAAFVSALNENQLSFPAPATSDDIMAGNLLTPGAGVVRMLENSPTFAPTILSGLAAAAGLEQGDSGLETYLNVLQAAIDTVDPINFADNLIASESLLLLSEVIGDNVIPNEAYPEEETLGKAFPAPLSGTEPLASELNAKPITTTPVVLAADYQGMPSFSAIARYIGAAHGTPVLPTEGENAEAVFTEMVTQAASLVGSTALTATPAVQPANPAVLKAE